MNVMKSFNVLLLLVAVLEKEIGICLPAHVKPAKLLLTVVPLTKAGI